MAGSVSEARESLAAEGITEHGMERALSLYGDLLSAFQRRDWDHVKMTLGGGDISVGLAVIAAARMVEIEEVAKERSQ